MIRLALLLILVMAVDASPALGSVYPETGPDVGALPGLYESYDEAVAYWKAVPGVPSVEEACGTLPPLHVTATDPTIAAAWGVTAADGNPCQIWVEQAWLDLTDSWMPVLRDRERCHTLVHEVGHILGLNHGSYGDEANIMAPTRSDQRLPKVCEDAYPLMPVLAEPVCMPAWAFYGPYRAFTSYETGNHRRAWKAFKRWRKHYPKAAHKIMRRAPVC